MKRLEEISGALPLVDQSYRPIRNKKETGKGPQLAAALADAFATSRLAGVNTVPVYGSQHIAVTSLAETALTTALTELAGIDPQAWLGGGTRRLRLFAYRGAINGHVSHLGTLMYQQEHRSTWAVNNLLAVELNDYNGGLNITAAEACPLQGQANLVNVPEVFQAVAADIAGLQIVLHQVG
jgi:hypothetical protein